jgi:tetratricopeptide (TPR) repeat protein
MRSRIAAVVIVSFGVACAARGPTPQLLAEIGRADLLLREGCYRCLGQALVIYEGAAVAPRGVLNARWRAFEAAILLAMRSKELGLPADQYLSKARVLATNLPASAAPALPSSTFTDALDAFQGELSGFDPEERQARTRRSPVPVNGQPVALPARVALQPAFGTSMVIDYLALALDCEDPRARKDVDAAAVLARHDNAPLIQFRLVLCAMRPDLLVPLRERDARWVDTYFIEGRRHMTARPDPDVLKAVQSFAAARTAFPESDAITLALGNAQNALSEFDPALANFDVVLGKVPTHRDALLGRVTSLTYLNRHNEAIASATHLIDLGTWHIGDAYYLRAWNRFQLKELDAAWDDVERASKLLVNTSVYTLAGFIAYARQELETAINRFDRAYAMDRSNCEAIWTGSLVHVERQQWPLATPKFATSVACFADTAARARTESTRLQAAAMDETVKQRRIAVQQKIIDTSLQRSAQAAFNAAQGFLRQGDKSEAMRHVELAAEHPSLHEKAATLRTAIEKMP